MENLFACNPDCSITTLTALDWAVTLAILVIVFTITRMLRKWAFNWNKYPDTSIKWHVPRFIFIAFILAVITTPIVWSIFGHLAAKMYGQFIFPEAACVIYFIWLLGTEQPNKSR